MPIKCKYGGTARYRFRTTSKKRLKQRLAFCDGGVVEVTNFKNGKKFVKRVK